MTYNIYYSVYKVDYKGAAAPKKKGMSDRIKKNKT